jgi:hypothetical protein
MARFDVYVAWDRNDDLDQIRYGIEAKSYRAALTRNGGCTPKPGERFVVVNQATHTARVYKVGADGKPRRRLTRGRG